MITEPNYSENYFQLLVLFFFDCRKNCFWTSLLSEIALSNGLPNSWVYLTEVIWKLCSVISVEEVRDRNCSGINLVILWCVMGNHAPEETTWWTKAKLFTKQRPWNSQESVRSRTFLSNSCCSQGPPRPKQPININKFSGLSREWMGSNLFMCCPFLGRKGKYINKIPRKSQDNAGTVAGQTRENCVCVLSYLLVCFPTLRKKETNKWQKC